MTNLVGFTVLKKFFNFNGIDHALVMLQVEMEFLNHYICKLKERKFHHVRKETLYSGTENHYSQRAA